MTWIKLNLLYYYHRASKTRLPDDPTSAHFENEVARLDNLVAGQKNLANSPDSITSLIEEFLSSPGIQNLKEKTRKEYDRRLKFIKKHIGWKQVSDISEENVNYLQHKLKRKPSTSNNTINVLRILLNYARKQPEKYKLDHNPASKFKRQRTRHFHRPWEKDEINKFRNHWQMGTLERTIFELLEDTGLNEKTILSLESSQINELGLELNKSQAFYEGVVIELGAISMASLYVWRRTRNQNIGKALESGRLVPEGVKKFLLVTATGKQLKIDHLRHVMKSAYDAAGLKVGLENGGVTTKGLGYETPDE